MSERSENLSVNRRQFVAAGAATIALVVLGQSNAHGQPASGGKVDVGTLSDYPNDVISDKHLKSDKLIVVRNSERIYAMSSRCTHKGTNLGMKNGRIRCPAHGSVFSEQGTPVSGPAKSALTRYGISLNDKGRLIVDRSKSFGERDWDKPDAFVSTTPAA
jgi:nitrite reductase/ring-hydroxylating ferredoxin subunit